MSNSKNKDINNKSKQNYPNYQMQMMLLMLLYFVYTTTRSGRITANATNWKTAQYQCVGQDWCELYMTIQCRVYLQCSYLQVFLL
jgi:hypothetical protein